MTNKIQLINKDSFQSLIKKAEDSPRRRINYNYHQNFTDNPNRFLNVLLKDTYIRPHRHSKPPKSESFIILEGSLALFIFNDEGEIIQKHILGFYQKKQYNYGIDIGAGVWHSLVVLSSTAVCFEVKPGPYIETTDKEFALWSPDENSKDKIAYIQKLEQAINFL